MSQPDGGPAFAQFDYHVSPGGDCVIDRVGGGMSLCDYFAAHFAAGIVAGVHANTNVNAADYKPQDIARVAYSLAAAMLAERAK